MSAAYAFIDGLPLWIVICVVIAVVFVVEGIREVRGGNMLPPAEFDR
jgi:hypothetical protein